MIKKLIKRFRSAVTGRFVSEEFAGQNKSETVSQTFSYGHDRTFHQTGEINVELFKGEVVGVWFRCLHLPFTQSECSADRAADLKNLYRTPAPKIAAVEVVNPAWEEEKNENNRPGNS